VLLAFSNRLKAQRAADESCGVRCPASFMGFRIVPRHGRSKIPFLVVARLLKSGEKRSIPAKFDEKRAWNRAFSCMQPRGCLRYLGECAEDAGSPSCVRGVVFLVEQRFMKPVFHVKQNKNKMLVSCF